MSLLIGSEQADIDRVLHPTDLSESSLVAFHHALAIAIRRGAQLTLLHAVGRRATDSWPGFPAVRDTLARWRTFGTTEALEDKIRRSRISKLEVQVRDPVQAAKEHMDRHPHDMIVMATEGRSGLSRLVQPSRAEKLAREARLFTLFVPSGCRAFVSDDSGRVTLHKILIPIDPDTDPRPAMLRAVRAAALLDDPSLEITLLHVGGAGEVPMTDAPELPFCRWNIIQRQGEVVEEIVTAAEELTADAIYMSTSWRKPAIGRSDGGVTERVLHRADCPVAVVPVGVP